MFFVEVNALNGHVSSGNRATLSVLSIRCMLFFMYIRLMHICACYIERIDRVRTRSHKRGEGCKQQLKTTPLVSIKARYQAEQEDRLVANRLLRFQIINTVIA